MISTSDNYTASVHFTYSYLSLVADPCFLVTNLFSLLVLLFNNFLYIRRGVNAHIHLFRITFSSTQTFSRVQRIYMRAWPLEYYYSSQQRDNI